MPKTIDGVEYFTQDEVNNLTGKARGEGRQAGSADVLREIGVDSVDSAKSGLKLVTEQGTKIKELTTSLETVNTEKSTVTGKLKSLSLERAAEAVGGELKLTPVKAKQVLLLLGVKAEEFDSEKQEDRDALKAKFDTFLKVPENAHFAGTEAVETSGRKPGQGGGSGGGSEWDGLRGLMTASLG